MLRPILAAMLIVCTCGSQGMSQSRVRSPSLPQLLTYRIEALRWQGGHLPGAYMQNAGAAGLKWYFSMIGVHALALDNKHDAQVQGFLTSYLGTATRPGSTINDVADLTKPVIVWRLSDSDDSYAAGVLSLASWYGGRGKRGRDWFESNLASLKEIAKQNLLAPVDPQTGLTLTFNSLPTRLTAPLPENQEYCASHANDLATAQRYTKIAQMMDNCEVYRGLKDFAARLTTISDPDAPKYEAAATRVATGIASLYDRDVGAFRVNTENAAIGTAFYPDRFVQAAPQVFGVDFGDATQEMYDGAWKYLNAGGDRWWEGHTTDNSTQIFDGQTQKYPNMMLAYLAKLRGERSKSQSHLKYFRQTMESPGTLPEFSNIAELGWALRAAR